MTGLFRHPLFRVDVTAVHRRSRPVGPVRHVQFRQQYLMQLVEDAGFGPPVQPAPAGHPGAEAEFLRQVIPARSRCAVQHEQDALQALPVRDRPRPRSFVPLRRQQRFDQLPQPVVNVPGPTHDERKRLIFTS